MENVSGCMENVSGCMENVSVHGSMVEKLPWNFQSCMLSGVKTNLSLLLCAVTVGNLAVASGNQSLEASWDSVSGSNVSGYRVFFGPTGSTVTDSRNVPGRGSGRVSYTVTGLLNFTSYGVDVGVLCTGEGGEEGVGARTSMVSTTAPASKCVCMYVCVCMCVCAYNTS